MPRDVLDVVTGVVIQILLDRFVSDDEVEPLRFSGILCLLQIEGVEEHAVRDGLCPAVFDRDEVELIVFSPVVADGVGGAILKLELRMARRGVADIYVLGRSRDKVIENTGG